MIIIHGRDGLNFSKFGLYFHWADFRVGFVGQFHGFSLRISLFFLPQLP